MICAIFSRMNLWLPYSIGKTNQRHEGLAAGKAFYLTGTQEAVIIVKVNDLTGDECGALCAGLPVVCFLWSVTDCQTTTGSRMVFWARFISSRDCR